MIVIISKPDDRSVDRVIEWLLKFGYSDILRLSEDKPITILGISLEKESIEPEIDLMVEDRIFKVSEIDFFWYRNGNIKIEIPDFSKEIVDNQLKEFLGWELTVCRNFIIRQLQQRPSLGNFFRSTVNKLEKLQIAKEIGFDIPNTFISSKPSELINYIEKNQCITKPIGEAMPIGEDYSFIDLQTAVVDLDKIKNQSEHIFPSLIQEKIEKWLEIRAFILYKEVYAMAIFSQNNRLTDTDYRNYDFSKMNRMISYKLPSQVENKILKFMEKCELNTGSIDLVLTPDNRFVFLEVNPAGNIEMVGDSCNYWLEKKIAEHIIQTIPSCPIQS
jgi:ATP-GRASP peptide maturase of grasp-with-spasm system